MRVWSTIYNFFGVLLLMFMLIVLHRDIRENERILAQVHLQYAVDYATEAAFLSSLEGGDLGLTYEDLRHVKVNPNNVMESFKSVFLMNYDMALSKENRDMLDYYISTALLVVSDGYYLATLEEVHTGNLGIEGGEYRLKWGLKKPFALPFRGNNLVEYDENPDRFMTFDLSTDKWILAMEEVVGGNRRLRLFTGDLNDMYNPNRPNGVTKEIIVARVNEIIMDDINKNIERRNILYDKETSRDFIYLPSSVTSIGVNPISKPTFFIVVSDIDFAASSKLTARSVGGYSIGEKKRVLAFSQDGELYYCYEGQIPMGVPNIEVRKFYNTVDEAATAGYRPHMEYLTRPVS